MKPHYALRTVPGNVESMWYGGDSGSVDYVRCTRHEYLAINKLLTISASRMVAQSFKKKYWQPWEPFVRRT